MCGLLRICALLQLLCILSAECAEKCCAPDAFEVDIKALGVAGSQANNKQRIMFIYEQKKSRWLLDVEVPKDEKKSSKLLLDHAQGKQYYINHKGCTVAPLAGEMASFCVPQNASHYGDFTYGEAGSAYSLPFSAWGWDSAQAPIRMMTKVTAGSQCIPLQDDIIFLTTGDYHVTGHNLPCNPWKEPERVTDKRDCYQCLYKIPMKRRGPNPEYHVLHLQYNNFYRGLHRVPRFEVPDNCEEEAENFDPDEIQLTDIQRFFILRMKNK